MALDFQAEHAVREIGPDAGGIELTVKPHDQFVGRGMGEFAVRLPRFRDGHGALSGDREESLLKGNPDLILGDPGEGEVEGDALIVSLDAIVRLYRRGGPSTVAGPTTRRLTA